MPFLVSGSKTPEQRMRKCMHTSMHTDISMITAMIMAMIVTIITENIATIRILILRIVLMSMATATITLIARIESLIWSGASSTRMTPSPRGPGLG